MEELAYKIKADFLSALAHPLRLQIIEVLKKGERKAGSINKALGIQQSSLSRHLTILKEAGVLKSRQEGTVIYYDLEDHNIFQVLQPIAKMLYAKLKKTERVLGALGSKRAS